MIFAHTDLQLSESREGVITQRVDSVVFQVEFSQTWAGREGAVREGGQTVWPQPEDTKCGENGTSSRGYLWNLENKTSLCIRSWLTSCFLRFIYNHCWLCGHCAGRQKPCFLWGQSHRSLGRPGRRTRTDWRTGYWETTGPKDRQKTWKPLELWWFPVKGHLLNRKFVSPLWSPPVSQTLHPLWDLNFFFQHFKQNFLIFLTACVKIKSV